MPVVAIPAITGAQQSAIAAAFVDRDWTVRGGSRTARATPFGETSRVDLDDAASLAAFLDGVDVLAFTLPQDHRPGAMPRFAEALTRAAEASGVGRIVMNLATQRYPDARGSLFDDLNAVWSTVERAATPSVILQPTVFMDNLTAPWSAGAIVGGGVVSYPARRDAAISWLSHRSLAQFAVAAAVHPHPAPTYRIGGPAVDGDGLASVLVEVLGRNIRYEEMPLEVFAGAMDAGFGPPTGERLRSAYEFLNAHPRAQDVGTDAAQALGVTPESFADFARRTDWAALAGS